LLLLLLRADRKSVKHLGHKCYSKQISRIVGRTTTELEAWRRARCKGQRYNLNLSLFGLCRTDRGVPLELQQRRLPHTPEAASYPLWHTQCSPHCRRHHRSGSRNRWLLKPRSGQAYNRELVSTSSS